MRRPGEVVKEAAEEVGLDVEKEVAELQAKGLVFREGDCFPGPVFVSGERA